MDPLEYLQQDDLDETMQLVADRCGMEVVIALMRHMPGETIAVPHVKSRRDLCRRYVIAMHTQRTVRWIARQLGCTPEHVRKIMRALNQ